MKEDQSDLMGHIVLSEINLVRTKPAPKKNGRTKPGGQATGIQSQLPSKYPWYYHGFVKCIFNSFVIVQ